jgi:hypothetical protein
MAHAGADKPGSSQPAPVRFQAVDVWIDSGKAFLAVYQFELSDPTGRMKIVGIEGSDHAAFADPPYYDPQALARDRAIIAAFNTGGDLPSGRTRVARVHVQVEGRGELDCAVELMIAADSEGQPIEATVWVELGG